MAKVLQVPFVLLWDDLSSLGRRLPILEAAETQNIDLYQKDCDLESEGSQLMTVPESREVDDLSEKLVGTVYLVREKDSATARALDKSVDIAGSRWFFGGVIAVIVGWAIAGAATGAPDLWQIILQDVSSIQCYISDMILMRQQMNDTREHLCMIAILRSRANTVARCIRILMHEGRLKADASMRTTLHSLNSALLTQQSTIEMTKTAGRSAIFSIKSLKSNVYDDLEKAARELDSVGDANELIPEDMFDKLLVVVADVMGSIWMLTAFVIGIIVWISLGPKYDFSNNWQLWLNTCTALQQTLSTCLLTLARNRHTHFVEKCMNAIFFQDCELEYRARRLTSDGDKNEAIPIHWAPANKFERTLDWYAAFIGSGYMVSLSVALLALWLGIGHPLAWSDNWWLIIGTFTGVVGTFNAAVLRYSLYRFEHKTSHEYDALLEQDRAIFEDLSLPFPNQHIRYKKDVMTRISLFFSWICATPWAVLAILALIIALLIGATVVLWNETAQLLVNSVTMIVESFFLIVLISAHNLQATEHRIRLHDLLMRRLQLLVIIRRVETKEAANPFIDDIGEPDAKEET